MEEFVAKRDRGGDFVREGWMEAQDREEEKSESGQSYKGLDHVIKRERERKRS